MNEPLIDRRLDTKPGLANRQTLRRDREHGMVAGVCAGLGDHLDIDPTLVRAVVIGSLVFGGFGAALYLALWVLMDEPPTGPKPRRRDVERLDTNEDER